MSSPDITLCFLQASRSIRIAWLLEELSLHYSSIFFPRENNTAPADFRSRSGNNLGKAPSLTDGQFVINESGAITEYLIEKYDKDGKLMGGKDEAVRNKVRMFIHAAEGTLMVHCLAITYARWFAPESVQKSGELKELEKGLAVNVGKDLDWLNSELEGKKFLAGDHVTAADTMVLFSIQFIFARDLVGGRKVSEWKNVEKWIKDCEATESWKKAVEKTGHKM
ncbi:related to GTT1-glutathione S-transferase [Phialocephala subalpina]|uniref:Related to GTT1-glutathione S-transferase n=1 Tax=Phialocephala subalpina TaxID=576137 RepID=A0A1L7X264_9HELO|nr:related to GTT1-glutathione S-transferase [Phialocephala subalpina]